MYKCPSWEKWAFCLCPGSLIERLVGCKAGRVQGPSGLAENALEEHAFQMQPEGQNSCNWSLSLAVGLLLRLFLVVFWQLKECLGVVCAVACSFSTPHCLPLMAVFSLWADCDLHVASIIWKINREGSRLWGRLASNWNGCFLKLPTKHQHHFSKCYCWRNSI